MCVCVCVLVKERDKREIWLREENARVNSQKSNSEVIHEMKNESRKTADETNNCYIIN